MTTIAPQTLRLQIDTSNRSKLVLSTGAKLSLWRGNDTRFELGLFAGADVLDVSNIASLVVEVDISQNTQQAPLMYKSITGAELDATLDSASWDDESKEHAAVDFTAAETNLDLSGAKSKTFWLVVWATLDDGKIVTLARGDLLMEEDNAGASGTPPVNEIYYTKDQADAAFQASSEKDQASGYPGLNIRGFLDSKQIPSFSQDRYFLPFLRRLAAIRFSEVESHRPDINGMTPSKRLVTGISQAAQAVVTFNSPGDIQAGDYVELSEVEGMVEINGVHKVASVTSGTATLEVDSTGFTAYSDDGYIESLEGKRLAVLHLGDSFNVQKSSGAIVRGLERAVSRRQIVVNPSYGPAKKRDGMLLATYMDYDYSAGVTHFVKNDGGTNGRVISPNYEKWFTGGRFEVPSGENLTFFGQGDSLCNGNRADVFYLKNSSGGTFKVQSSSTSISGGFGDEVTGISANDASPGIEKVSIRLDAPADFALRVEATAGSVEFIGAVIYRDDLPEILNLECSVSSLTASTAFGALEDGVGSGILEALSPDLVTFCFADEGTGQADALDHYKGWLDDNNPKPGRSASTLVLAPVPTFLNSEAETAAVTDSLRDKADEHGFAFLSQYDLLGGNRQLMADYFLSDDGGNHNNETASLLIATMAAYRLGIPPVLWTSATPERTENNGKDIKHVIRTGGAVSFEDAEGVDVFRIPSSGGMSGPAFEQGLLNQGLGRYTPPGGFVFASGTGTVNLGDVFDQDMTSDFAIELWVLMKRPGGTGVLISSRSSTPRYRISVSNIGAITADLRDSTSTVQVIAPAIVPSGQSAIFHIVATCDVSESDGFKLYVNNNLIGSADPTVLGSLVHVSDTYLGSNNGTAAFLPGVIQQCNLWTRNIDGAGIDELYKKGAHRVVRDFGSPAAASLYAGYNMRSFGAGTQCLDWSGNGRHGTIAGDVTLYNPE